MASTNTNTQKSHSSSFGQTLQFITSIKLSELEKQSNSYKAHSKGPLVIAQSVLQNDASTTLEVIKAVEQLSKSIKTWTGSGSLSHSGSTNNGIVSGSLQLKNLEFWLQQAQHDPEFAVHGGSDHAKRWLKVLESHIKKTQMRFDAAMLFGKLFNEWIGSGDSSAIVYQGPNEDGDDLVEGNGDEKEVKDAGADAVSTFSEFIEVGRKEMYEQKQKLVSIIFDDHPIDTAGLKSYLEHLFSGEEPQHALEGLRSDIRNHGRFLLREKLTTIDVGNAIKGVLAGGLMDEEKRTTLKAFQENSAAMEELASVLTMRVASLGGKEGWKWPKDGVKVEMRRALNGKYRAFTDPDIIDALLLQHLGVAWQVKLKKVFLNFFNSKAWTRAPLVQHRLQEKRRVQLKDDGSHSIRQIREQNYQDFFFVSQLADSLSGPQPYDDLLDAPGDPNPNADGDEDPSAGKSPAQVKQKLLNIIQTESYLNTALHGTHTILRSDLEWFGPSLPHASILTILEFLGLGKKWVAFYKEFLEAPVKFTGAGGFGVGVSGVEEEVRVRKRGTPISYALSVVCGEAVLFVMDYAVNRRSGGSNAGTSDETEDEKKKGVKQAPESQGEGVCLYRMHDDLWIWDRKKENVARAWREMKTFAGLVGLKFNETKTGSIVVGDAGASKTSPGVDTTTLGSTSKDSNVPSTSSGPSEGSDHDLELPKGDIRWGFLLFSPSATTSSPPSSSSTSSTPTSPRFIIDQAQVTSHIIELRRQLAASKSIFGWVNVWNKYMRFFVRNFGAAGGSDDGGGAGNGKMAKCTAERAAVVDVVETLARIQREVFEDLSIEGGDVDLEKGVHRTALEYLRRTLELRFGVTDLPDGYFYFPISSGGLEVWNPMVEVLAMERGGKPLIAFEEKEEKVGEKAKAGASSESDEDSEDSEAEGGGQGEDNSSDDETESTQSTTLWDNDHFYYFPQDRYFASSKFPARMHYDTKEYKALKQIWDTVTQHRRTGGHNLGRDVREPDTQSFSGDYTMIADEFMSKEEYDGLREGWLKTWAQSYEDMMEYVKTCNVVCVPKVRELIAANAGGYASVPLPTRGRGRGRGRGRRGGLVFSGRGGATGVGSSPAQRAISGGWEAMSFYERWVTSVYGEEVVERFGGLDVVDQSLIPVGMVQLFKTSRMKLDQ